jgi:hypothetical protein
MDLMAFWQSITVLIHEYILYTAADNGRGEVTFSGV